MQKGLAESSLLPRSPALHQARIPPQPPRFLFHLEVVPQCSGTALPHSPLLQPSVPPVPASSAFQMLRHAAGQPPAPQVIHVPLVSLTLTFLASQPQTTGPDAPQVAPEVHLLLSVVS